MKRTAEQVARSIADKQAELHALNQALIARLVLERIFPIVHGAGQVRTQFVSTVYNFDMLKTGTRSRNRADVLEAMKHVAFQIFQCDTGELLLEKTLDTLDADALDYIQQRYFPNATWNTSKR